MRESVQAFKKLDEFDILLANSRGKKHSVVKKNSGSKNFLCNRIQVTYWSFRKHTKYPSY